MTKLYAWLALGLCSFNADFVLADDDGLYGQPIPNDAVFIRFIGKGSSAFGFDFADRVDGLSYLVVSKSLLTEQPQATYNTVIGDGSDRQLFEEPDRSSRSKVNLLVINNGTTAVSLFAKDGEVPVLEDVMPGQVSKREVNPVSLDFQVSDAGSAAILADVDLVLKRGQDITFAVIGDQVEVIPTSFGDVLGAEQ